MRTSTCLLAVALTAYAARPASAQEGGATTGFPIGEKSRIHTELTVGVAFDSNVSRFDEDLTQKDPDGRLLVRPGVSIDVPGSSVRLGFGTHASINYFFQVGDNGNDHNQATVGADATLDFALGSRSSVVGFSLSDTFIRTPAYIDDPGAVAADEVRFKQWANQGIARFTLRPGGGALEFDLGYTNTVNIYDDLDNSLRHGAIFEARYKFLPKTAAVFHGDFTVFDIVGTETSMTNPSTPYNLTLGLIGQVTPRISVDLAAGFGDTLTWQMEKFSTLAPENRRTFIATAGATYQFNERSFASLHYQRSLVPIIILDNYISDAATANFQVGIGGRLILGALGSYEHRSFPVPDGGVHVVIGDARVAYWFFEFLSLSVNYRVLFQSSQFEGAVGGGGDFFLEDYVRHQAFVNLTLRY